MPCLRPIDVHNKMAGKSFLVPCGKCDECLQRRKMAFVFRCEQERISKNFRYCHYITLTYNDKFLPFESYSLKKGGFPVDPVSTGESLLCPYDLTQFFKRYRLFANDEIKYFAAGEYGSDKFTKRPHFHIILFCNQNWKDCVHLSQLAWSYLVAETVEARNLRYKRARKEKRIIKRDSRNMANRELIGRVNVLAVTYRRTCYVAKYCNKCLYSDEVVPPFVRLSNGLGKSFLQSDTAALCKEQNRHYTYFQNGCACAIPRYYSHKMYTLEQMDSFQLEMILCENPPDDIVSFVYKADTSDSENDCFMLQLDLDIRACRAWIVSHRNSVEFDVKSRRLARYGFCL